MAQNTWPVPRLRNRKCPECPDGNLNLEHWRTDTETDAKQTLLQHRFFAVFRCYTHPTSHPAMRIEFDPRRETSVL